METTTDKSKSVTPPSSRSALGTQEWVIESMIRVLGFSGIGFVLLIFFFLIKEGAPAFIEIPLDNLSDTRWYPTFGVYGIIPLILGSLLVTIGAIVIAVPLGISVAVFLAEIAPPWLRNILKPMIEIIAGIPSVVLGFLGIVVLSQWLRVNLGVATGLSALTGSLLLAYMALPTIISVAEDALDAVPNGYRDAALAMGATKWQTIWRVLLPSAKTGILTAVMLGVGRALGETMAVMMVTGNAARMPLGLDAFIKPARTMTATIAAEMGEVAQGSTHYHVLFAVGMILFLITFLINALAAISVFRQKRRSGGRLLS